MNDCDKCLWATRSGGCASWSCEFIDKHEAYVAWKAQDQPQSKRVIETLREVRGEK